MMTPDAAHPGILCVYTGVVVETKVQKWGNSLGVRIPRSLANGAKLRPGTPVEILGDADAIVIRPTERPRYRLSELLKRVKRGNLHAAIDTGPAVGREVL
jgi:antitoxin MazE